MVYRVTRATALRIRPVLSFDAQRRRLFPYISPWASSRRLRFRTRTQEREGRSGTVSTDGRPSGIALFFDGWLGSSVTC